MASDQEPLRVGQQPPFSVPAERRDPARRFRGRLVAPVTIWTAGRPPGGAGLTVSSILVAEGQPARLLGLIDPTSAFWEAMQETGSFVVHVLAAGDRHLAERFAEIRPPIRGPFQRLEVAESPWGPVLGGRRPNAACRLAQRLWRHSPRPSDRRGSARWPHPLPWPGRGSCLLRNPQVELVPCRRCHHGPGVTDTSETMEGGTGT